MIEIYGTNDPARANDLDGVQQRKHGAGEASHPGGVAQAVGREVQGARRRRTGGERREAAWAGDEAEGDGLGDYEVPEIGEQDVRAAVDLADPLRGLQAGHRGVVLAVGVGRQEEADDAPVEREQPTVAVPFDVRQGW
ncbi:hypothetical protein FIBSPDRAFT_903344 [Athelia psychrophila]|uniref:Uncharacterized protein n=1 Tax=Athelia psychrophila TaxID=1759441 RepID=A0A167W4L1_9AGAM|nr:hypothetical protein FIBSPDRAFT_903344 [Fibularhizoctonia sp. CBS 109695]